MTQSLIFLPVAVIGLLSPSSVSRANAITESGITITVYNNFGYNQSPPLPTVSGRPEVGTSTVSRIQQNFDQSPLFGMYEDFIVRYEGFITAPITGNIAFLPTGDDGTKFYLNDSLIDNNWRDKGGGGNQTAPQPFVAGVSQPFTYWFYENGGGAWTTLYWNIGNGWEIVPDSAFTKQSTTTTTTIAPYFNAPNTLTATANTDGSVDLTWSEPDASNVSPYMYDITFFDLEDGVESGGWGVWTYASNTSYTLSTSMFSGSNPVTTGYGDVRFKVRAGSAGCVGESQSPCVYGPYVTVDAVVLDPTPTTTTTTSTTTTSTTTTIPDVPTQTTQPEIEPEPTVPVETTNPDTEVTETTVGRTTTPETTETTVLQQTEQQETTPPTDETPISQEEAIAQISEIDINSVTADELGSVLDEVFSKPLTDEQFAEVIDAILDEPLTDEQLAEVVDALESDSVTEEQVAAAVEKILENEITEDQATELATSKKVLQSIDGDQAAEIFDAIDISQITAEEAEQIVAAVQDAPQEVRESFEEEINVFEGAVDTYVPLGSSIPVGQRRVLIAIAAATAAIPVAPTRRS